MATKQGLFVLFGMSAEKAFYTKHFPVLSSGDLLVCMFYWFVLFFLDRVLLHSSFDLEYLTLHFQNAEITGLYTTWLVSLCNFKTVLHIPNLLAFPPKFLELGLSCTYLLIVRMRVSMSQQIKASLLKSDG